MRVWLVGKKTYLLAAVVAGVTIALLVTGRMTTPTALSLLLFAAAGFPATFRAALAKHQAEELALLGSLVRVAGSVAGHNAGAVEVGAVLLTQQAVALGGELQADVETAGETAR